MPDLKISQLSSAAPTTAAQIPANINSTTVRFTLQEALAQPTTATGDTLYRNSSGEMVKLAVGASGAVKHVSSAGLPAWLVAGTTGQYLRVGASAGELGWSSAQLVPSTAGVSSGGLLHISSAGTPAWLAAGTTGQYLRVGASAGEIGWQARQWGVTAYWEAPATTTVAFFEVPYNVTVEQFTIASASAGSVTVEARLNSLSSTPSGSAANVSSAQPIATANAKSNSSAISSWSDVTWDKGQWVTLAIVAAASAAQTAVSLRGTERAS